MKKYLLSFAVLMMGMALTTACSSDDDDNNVTPQPEPVVPVETYHYDLTVTVGKHGGMASSETHLTMSVDSLTNPNQTVNFEGNGIEITDYTIENIYDKKYMYQVPVSGDRFTKLQIKNNQLKVVRERPFANNTFVPRKYTHAWINDSTLIIMGANGDANKVIWTKLNTNNMTIINEGELALSLVEGYETFTTSGLLTYRQSDKKLFYFYYGKKGSGRKATKEPFFHVAVINPETMAVEKDIINKEASEMQGSAYGELMQNFMFFDDNDNLYLSTFSTVDEKNIGRLLRIKKGQYDFEAGYNAFPEAKGKLLTVLYLGGSKVLAYSGDAAAGTNIGSTAYYYSIIDINTKTSTRLAYKGAEIPYSSGSFAQRSVFNSKENKAYFGVNTADEQAVYIYDVKTGDVTKGISLASGYYFDLIRVFED